MDKLINYGFKSVNLYFSGTCNLQCTYCFQPKLGSHMAEVNKKIINWISSGKMEDDIELYIGKDINAFCLWGGEPSVNLPYLVERLPIIFEKFPNFKEISYSTNMSTRKLAQNTLDLILKGKELSEKLNRKFTASIQISIDGVPAVNDSNRIGSSSKIITDNITYILEELEKNKVDSSNVNFHFKGTQSAVSLRYLNQENHLFEHYKYFDDLYSKWSKISKLYPRGGEYITLVFPGNYTQEDGRILSSIISTLLSDDFKKKQNWNNNLNFRSQVTDRIIASIHGTMKANGNISKYEWLRTSVCSAGCSCAGLTYDGKFHWCHSTYFFDKEARKYIRENKLITDFEANQGFSFSNFERYIDNVSYADLKDPLAVARTMELPAIYRSNPEARIAYTKLMINELADANQISPCFKEDLWQNLATNYVIFGGNECIANNLWEFGSIWIRNISHFKLLFNGTFEQIINKYGEI